MSIRCRLGRHDYQPAWRILGTTRTRGTITFRHDDGELQVTRPATVTHEVAGMQCTRCHQWRA